MLKIIGRLNANYEDKVIGITVNIVDTLFSFCLFIMDETEIPDHIKMNLLECIHVRYLIEKVKFEDFKKQYEMEGNVLMKDAINKEPI